MKNFLIYIPPFIEQDRPNLNNHWVILTLELLPQIIEKYNVTVVMGETQYKFLQKNTSLAYKNVRIVFIKDEDLVLKISGSMGSEYSYCIVKNLSLSELVSITKLWDQAASPEDSLEEYLEKYKAEVIPIYSCQEEGYPIDFFDVEFDVDTGITLFTELSEDRQEEMLDSKECYNKYISMSLF